MLRFLLRALKRRTYTKKLEALTALSRSGKYAEAEATAAEALAVGEEVFGGDAAEVVTPLYVMAGARLSLDKPEEALAACERAVKIAEASAGTPTEPRLPRLYELCAAIHEQRGRKDEVERIYRRLLDGHERMREPDEAAIATWANRLGLLIGEEKRTAEAELLLSRALALRERLYGARSLEAAEVLYNLGTVLAAAKRRDEAEKALRRAAVILEEKPGVGANILASATHNLGALAAERGQFDEAKRRFLAALAIAD